MAFLEDPRLRQRWNQISHNAEGVAENAAAGIWNLQQRYVNPCLGSLVQSADSCTGLCFGDREERARRQRERERGARRSRAEYSFDFYGDWDDDDDALADTFGDGRGLLGGWGSGEDWDRMLAGSGSAKGRSSVGANVIDQPGRNRGMSYGTAGPRRKAIETEDPTVIPSTAPLGFLGRLPFKIGGTLRYKPSAANLQDHPGGMIHNADEHDPLLDSSDDDDGRPATAPQTRKRSGTAGSGDTSSSYRSRGDLFPSDGEGDEDAVPLDDEFAVALDRVDDRSSGKTRTSKGKRRADSSKMSRSVSRTTISSNYSGHSSLKKRQSSLSLPVMEDVEDAPSIEHIRLEDERAERAEEEEVAQKRRAAALLAVERGLNRKEEEDDADSVHEVKADVPEVEEVDEISDEAPIPGTGTGSDEEAQGGASHPTPGPERSATTVAEDGFVPARLPHFS